MLRCQPIIYRNHDRTRLVGEQTDGAIRGRYASENPAPTMKVHHHWQWPRFVDLWSVYANGNVATPSLHHVVYGRRHVACHLRPEGPRAVCAHPHYLTAFG